MKRDMDLVRQILFYLEAREPDDTGVELPDRTMDELRLHLHLMEDAGWISKPTFTRDSVHCMRITNSGYEFLESIKNETIWNKAKEITVKQTGGLSAAALAEAARQLVGIAIRSIFP